MKDKELNSKYNEPDSRWELWGAKTFDDHLEHNVIRGKFHNKVPSDIKEAYEVVEYLMAYSFYYYPMYDVALQKLLLIFEMAVKLCAKEKGIPLKKTTKKGYTFDEKLVDLINKVLPDSLANRREKQFHGLRKLRNLMVHADKNLYGGGIVKGNILPAICCINELFWNGEFFATNHSKLLSFKKTFENKCLIIEFNGQRILAHNFQLWESFKRDRDYYYISIDLILEFKEEEIPTETKTFELSKLIIEKDYLLGTTIDNEPLKIETTEKEENYKRYYIMRKMLTQLPEEQKIVYMNIIPNQVAEAGDLFLYKYAWE